MRDRANTSTKHSRNGLCLPLRGMAFDLTPPVRPPGGPARHHLAATADTCYWGYIDRDQPPCLEIDSGDIVHVEAITHHAGDAPDLLMDDGIRAIWSAIAEDRRGPGVHIMTGPIHVRGAEPGDTLAVRILDMTPRLPYGSQLRRQLGPALLDVRQGADHDLWARRREGTAASAPRRARCSGSTSRARPVYDVPGVITEPDLGARQPFSRPVQVPVRPHFGVMGVAPAEPGRHSSIPPGVFGGNVDNWRLGPGATMCYPVFVRGRQPVRRRSALRPGRRRDLRHRDRGVARRHDPGVRGEGRSASQRPLLETDNHWFTHGFGADLDEAMRGGGGADAVADARRTSA